jgi:hypothetical protein
MVKASVAAEISFDRSLLPLAGLFFFKSKLIFILKPEVIKLWLILSATRNELDRAVDRIEFFSHL